MQIRQQQALQNGDTPVAGVVGAGERAYLRALHALVRLPILQSQRDRAAGLNAAGYVTGYRGSPLGSYDAALSAAAAELAAHDIHFRPAVNEELAATAIWGTQQLGLWPDPRRDGVFAIWYGKGPGADRSLDALKHGNMAGSARFGGVLLLAGDDHGCRSSTLPHHSEQTLIAAGIPVLNPASVREYLDFGLHGIAMSRFSGCWVGFKATADIVESAASVALDEERRGVRLPEDFAFPDGGVNLRDPDLPMAQEERLYRFKLPAAQAYVRANQLDQVVVKAVEPKLAIVTTGKAYQDVRQALSDLGLDDASAARAGIGVFKVGLMWPLEPEAVRAFCRDFDTVLVVEEKRDVIEAQLKPLLYGEPGAPRCIVGKTDEHRRALIPTHGELQALHVARAIVHCLQELTARDAVRKRLARLERLQGEVREHEPPALSRIPFFCSGCPHNTSTKVPDASFAMAGIGCHALARRQPERRTRTLTHMGSEGANWIGIAPFSGLPHVFQNLGDGTYFHSGFLAIRAAVAAEVNITYKVLFNDAVAMTGGQPHDGRLTPDAISRQVHAEGVRKVVVVTDDPDKYPAGTRWAPGATVRHRDEIDAVQRELRDIPGVTVLIYDQTCAAELRRRRKRGLVPDPDRRVVINELVCEACGDCSARSNCISVIPVDTPWGRKRQIDQTNCNKDYSCIDGFCPSFVTVSGARLRKAEAADGLTREAAALPQPRLPVMPEGESYNVLLTGIGGTGVITLAAILGEAAHNDGLWVSTLDQLGLAQKNGAVASHVRMARAADDVGAPRIGLGGTTVLIACDLIAAVAPELASTLERGVTRVVANEHVAPPGQFLSDQSIDLGPEFLLRRLRGLTGEGNVASINATRITSALIGSAATANVFLLGYAYQKGLVPITEAAILAAIEQNGVATADNRGAFLLGRYAAHDRSRIEEAAGIATGQRASRAETLDEAIARRADFLTGYQDARYAADYVATVRRVADAERARVPQQEALARAVAENLFRLMSYKDEYEVARLYTDGSFGAAVARQFEAGGRLSVHLAPPLLARRDPHSGRLKKRQFGPWIFHVFRWLAPLKRLRGTPFDPVGNTAERRAERRLIVDYRATVEELLGGLEPATHARAVEIARLPEEIRGFGHVKAARIERASRRWSELMTAWRAELARRREPGLSTPAYSA